MFMEEKEWRIESNKSDLFWAILGTSLNVVMGIIVLPIMLIKLNKFDMAIWYVLAAIQSFIYLLDFGFSPTYTRNVTYAYSGVKTIIKDSIVDTSQINGKPNFHLLRGIYLTGKKIYRILGITAFVLLISVGLIYYRSILPSQDKMYYITYAVFIVAMVINIYYTYIPSYMRGIGAIKESYQAYVISRVIYIVVAFVLLMLNIGLLGVVIALLLSGLFLRLTSSILLKRYKKRNSIPEELSTGEYTTNGIFKEMLYNAKKESLIMISNFITSQAATFFCVSYYGLSISSKYGLTMQILTILSSLCLLYFAMVTPQFTQSRVMKDKKRAERLFCKSYLFLCLGFIAGILVIAFLGPVVIEFIGSETTLLPRNIVILLGCYVFLEKSFHICTSYIATSNKLSYTYAFIISALAILCGYAIIPKLFNVGVISYALIPIVVQVCYNGWKWPHVVAKDLEINRLQFITHGVKYWYTDIKNISLRK